MGAPPGGAAYKGSHVKQLRLGCSLAYEVLAPTAAFTFNVLPNLGGEQQLIKEEIVCSPDVPRELVTSTRGTGSCGWRSRRAPLNCAIRAMWRSTGRRSPPRSRPTGRARLPISILTYTLPSRYCESDLLAPKAWDLFGAVPDRLDQVRAICLWLQENIAYTAGATDARTSAWDVWQRREGSAGISCTWRSPSAGA